MADEAEKPDMMWRVVGGLVAMGTGLAARKLIDLGWRKATGRMPPANPESLDIKLSEAIGYAVLMGVGMEVTRIIATRAAARRYQAWAASGHAKRVLKP
jgi:hypothetical protein